MFLGPFAVFRFLVTTLEPLYSEYHWFSEKVSAIERFHCNRFGENSFFYLVTVVVHLCNLYQFLDLLFNATFFSFQFLDFIVQVDDALKYEKRNVRSQCMHLAA